MVEFGTEVLTLKAERFKEIRRGELSRGLKGWKVGGIRNQGRHMKPSKPSEPSKEVDQEGQQLA